MSHPPTTATTATAAATRSTRRSASGVVATSAKRAFAALVWRWMIALGCKRSVSSSMVLARRSRRAAISASSTGIGTGGAAGAVIDASAAGSGAGWVALMVSSLESEVAAELGDVASGLDVVEGVRDMAGLVDDDGAADDALDGLAVQLLLSEGAPPVHHRAVGVGQQRDGQALLLAELRELGRGVGRDTEHGVAVGLQRLEGVAEVAGLRGAPGGHRRRVEVHDHLAAAQVAERHRRSGVVGQREVGGGVAGAEPVTHGASSCGRWWT